MTGHWVVPPLWAGQTAYIVGGGASLRGMDFNLLRDRNVIAINSSYEKLPFAPFLFFMDVRWWWHHEEALQDFAGTIVSNGPIVPMKGTRRPLMLKRSVPDDGALSLDPTRLVCGKTSTHGAINLAILLGAVQIVLLGIDMRRAKDGVSHHHTPHPWPHRDSAWQEQIVELNLLAASIPAHVQVVNASLRSELTCWPKLPLHMVL